MTTERKVISATWFFKCLICGKKYPYPIGRRNITKYPKCCGKTTVAHQEITK